MLEQQPVDCAAERVAAVEDLFLATLGPGDCFYASPAGVQRGWGEDAQMWRGCGSAAELAGQFAVARVGGMVHPVMFGAVPFDARETGCFVWPRRRAVMDIPAARVSAEGGWVQEQAGGRLPEGHEAPGADGYRESVRKALARIGQGGLEKVVLARTLEVELPERLAYGRLMQTLCSRNTKGYTFALPLAEARTADGEAPMLVGASPELLVRRRGRHIQVNPLAGSIPRRPGGAVGDAALASTLLSSEKDRREHAIVVQEITRILRPFCVELSVPASPSAISTDTLWHLSTQIDGVLAEPVPTALELARALHPTPAICGYPTALARQAIGELESFERGYYAGLVGWQDEAGDGEWALALRCAQVRGRHLRLYAGAGIVAGSDPESEYVETRTKLATLYQALYGAPPCDLITGKHNEHDNRG